MPCGRASDQIEIFCAYIGPKTLRGQLSLWCFSIALFSGLLRFKGNLYVVKITQTARVTELQSLPNFSVKIHAMND